MPKTRYQSKTISEDRMSIVRICDVICSDYAERGYDLTLRQLYYQLVAQDLFPDDRKWSWTGTRWVRDANGTKNAEPNYKWLGDIVTDGRLAGFIDWQHIVDRTRNLMGNRHWDRPSAAMKDAADRYLIDKWGSQDDYVECWVEKDALIGVLETACAPLDVPFFSCRGYTSLSEIWNAAQRLLLQKHRGKRVHVIHLGDHDPSGIDMSRDIKARLSMFVSAHWVESDDVLGAHTTEISTFDSDREKGDLGHVHVLRVALNRPQIDRLDLPPNPTKMTDSRAASYYAEHRGECWELDALSPETLVEIITRAVKMFRDDARWDEALKQEAKGKRTLVAIHDDFPGVVRFLRGEE